MWILPVVSWFLCALLLIRRGTEWRVAWLIAAVLWGCLVTAFTEVLSLFNLLTAGGLVFCWAMSIAMALLLNFKLKRPWLLRGKNPFSPVEIWLLGGAGLIVVATLATAFLAPPNTWDSMTYHLSRVMHWLQNRSVEHYPTHILRQLEMNPWAEFAIAHFQALSGGDRYANLIQWFSMVGALVGVSLLAEKLGGDRRAQIFSALVTVTIPMGILQASSTQNDYVVAFWLLCFTWAGLQYMESKELKWAALLGASLGLAILTKGTAYLYALPFVLWIALVVLRGSLRRAYPAVVCIVVLVFLLNVNHYMRNQQLFGNPLSSGESKLFNEKISAGSFLSNFLRNSSLQLLSPIEDLNPLVIGGVISAHEMLNLNVDNPETTWPGMKFSESKLSYEEDGMANVLHALLVASLLPALIFAQDLRGRRILIRYVLAVAGGYVLFCLALKWQPWHSRLLLPLFVLGAPAVAIIAARYWKPAAVTAISGVLLAASLPWVFSNAHRPLMHISEEAGVKIPFLMYERDMYYFVNRWELYEQYKKVAEDIRQSKASNIGLVLSGDGWEYPIWMLIKETNPAVRIEHVEVENVSKSMKKKDFTPDYLVRIQ